MAVRIDPRTGVLYLLGRKTRPFPDAIDEWLLVSLRDVYTSLILTPLPYPPTAAHGWRMSLTQQLAAVPLIDHLPRSDDMLSRATGIPAFHTRLLFSFSRAIFIFLAESLQFVTRPDPIHHGRSKKTSPEAPDQQARNAIDRVPQGQRLRAKIAFMAVNR